jgi:hypothetical protein
MWWVEARFIRDDYDYVPSLDAAKERWEGLTYDQARSIYSKYFYYEAWYVRMGEML